MGPSGRGEVRGTLAGIRRSHWLPVATGVTVKRASRCRRLGRVRDACSRAFGICSVVECCTDGSIRRCRLGVRRRHADAQERTARSPAPDSTHQSLERVSAIRVPPGRALLSLMPIGSRVTLETDARGSIASIATGGSCVMSIAARSTSTSSWSSGVVPLRTSIEAIEGSTRAVSSREAQRAKGAKRGLWKACPSTRLDP